MPETLGIVAQKVQGPLLIASTEPTAQGIAATATQGGEATLGKTLEAAQEPVINTLGSIGSGYSFAWSSYFEALTVLFAVLALLWLGLWLLKRRSPSFGKRNALGMYIENRLAISSKQWLVVVRIDKRRLLIGVTDNNINLLANLEVEEDSSTALNIKKENSTDTNLNFEALLRGKREKTSS